MKDENNPMHLFAVTVSILGLALTAGYLQVSTITEETESPTVLGAFTDEALPEKTGDISITLEDTGSLSYLGSKGSSRLGNIVVNYNTKTEQDYDVFVSLFSAENANVVLKSTNSTNNPETVINNLILLNDKPQHFVDGRTTVDTDFEQINVILENPDRNLINGKLVITLF